MFPKHLTGVITERRAVSANLWIIRMRPAAPISFVPGQYVTVGLPVEGRLVERPYSVASDPRDPELEFFLEAVPGGKLSPHLTDVPAGGEVLVRPSAKGHFHFDLESGHENHFMIATVTGIAPFVSMLRSLSGPNAERRMRNRIGIVHAASHPQELAYQDELSRIAQRHSWIRYIPAISRIWLNPDWTGERGRAEDIARKYLDAFEFAPAFTTAYLCGNPHMIRNLEGILQRAGFAKEAVKREVYWPA